MHIKEHDRRLTEKMYREGRFQFKKKWLIFPAVFLLSIQFFDEVSFLAKLDRTGLKHIFVLAVCFWGIYTDVSEAQIRIKNFSMEISRVCKVTAALVAISFGYMFINGFSTGWLSEMYYLIVPLFFAYSVFKKDYTILHLEQIMDMFLYSSMFGFAAFIFVKLTGGQLDAISFVNSSSPFESECAHIFLMLYIFYTFEDNLWKRILSGVCCILAWKRMCLLYIIFVTLFHKRIRKDKEIPEIFPVAITFALTLIPAVVQLLLTDGFSNWFTAVTGVDLHKFLMFRFETIVTAFESGIPSRGLGTYLLVDVPWYDHFVRVSIHNDAVRLYLETSVAGVFLFAWGMSHIARKQYSFVVMLFLFIEMSVSHFLGNGSLPFWVIAYSMIFCFNRYSEDFPKTIKME